MGYYRERFDEDYAFTMTTGLASKRRYIWKKEGIFKHIRDSLDAADINDIIPKFNKLLNEKERLTEENKKLNDKNKAMLSEFKKKKIGKLRVIINKKHCRSSQQGIIYFDKRDIGKRVIVWEKK